MLHLFESCIWATDFVAITEYGHNDLCWHIGDVRDYQNLHILHLYTVETDLLTGYHSLVWKNLTVYTKYILAKMNTTYKPYGRLNELRNIVFLSTSYGMCTGSWTDTHTLSSVDLCVGMR